MNNKTVTLDVREDIRSGKEPFSKIMSTVARLGADENLLLLAPFEPKPLFAVLAKQGFAHHARQTENNDWEIWFTRTAKNHMEAGDNQREEAVAGKSETQNPKFVKWTRADSNRHSRW